jgi:hypothetical protein
MTSDVSNQAANTTYVTNCLTPYTKLASPSLTGTPLVPTAAPGTSTTQIASTAFVATSFATLASPSFTGNPTAPTQAVGTLGTSIATVGFVAASFAPLNSPVFTGTAQSTNVAYPDDSHNIATTNYCSNFAPINSAILTGVPCAPNPSTGTSTTQIATTQFVATNFASLASPTFSGVPIATTAAAGDNTTQIATNAFVKSNLPWACGRVNVFGVYSTANGQMQGTNVSAYNNGTGSYYITFSSHPAGVYLSVVATANFTSGPVTCTYLPVNATTVQIFVWDVSGNPFNAAFGFIVI